MKFGVLEIRRILLDLGFVGSNASAVPMVNSGVDVSFKDDVKGAFRFERKDGIKLRLALEPEFRKNGDEIKSWITTQKSDIYLEATFQNGEQFVWLFDAKYRIKQPKEYEGVKVSDQDFVPDDAINQIHRYRDALIHQEKIEQDKVVKTRPVFGAYALYPGFSDQENDKNPYDDAIYEVGIGAFSLLPSDDHRESLWLTNFLTKKFTNSLATYEIASSDKYFVEESPRIPYLGTEVTRFDDLVITANQLGASRDTVYIQRFEMGRAEFYHTKIIAFERQSIEHHIVNEARYISIAIDDSVNNFRRIDFVYPILNAKQIKRADISIQQSGTDMVNDPDEIYWLFKLGKSLRLQNSVFLPFETHFKLKLIGREN